MYYQKKLNLCFELPQCTAILIGHIEAAIRLLKMNANNSEVSDLCSRVVDIRLNLYITHPQSLVP